MAETARAAVLTAPRTFTLQEVKLPEVSEVDGLLRVEACGICGSDVEQFTAIRSEDYYPTIPGHEPIGTIMAIGDEASRRWGVRVGDRVGVEAAISCGRCAPCRSGSNLGCTDPRLPPGRRVYSGVPMSIPPHLWGGYSEVLYLDREASIHKVPENVSLEEASLLNALANAIEWSVLVPRTQFGATAVVLGPGQRGLLCVAALREAGAGIIIVTGLRSDDHKLATARTLGADYTVCVEDDDLLSVVSDATDGALADLVIDTTPNATKPVVDALEIVRVGGTVVLAGLKWGREVPGFVSDQMIMKEITMRGVAAASSLSYRKAMQVLASHHHPLHLLHTHSFPLERAADAIMTFARETSDRTAIAVSINP